MRFFVPSLFDTATQQSSKDDVQEVLCDFSKRLEKLNKGDCITLRWTTQSRRHQKGHLLFVAKFWVTPFGTRKLRLQCHKIASDGRVGNREIILERHNGKVVR